MSLWTIFVLGTLRLSCNWNYDSLKEHYDNHMLIRKMCGINSFLDENKVTPLQTILDNVSLFTLEISNKISKVVIDYGHKVLKQKDTELMTRCDSFVFLSNVHFPTDFNLLLDVCRVLINSCTNSALELNLPGWREHESIYLKIKQKYNTLSKMRYSNSKKKAQQDKRKKIIHDEIKSYLSMVNSLLNKVIEFNNENTINSDICSNAIAYGNLFVNQIERRIFKGEEIASDEKVYSIFEPYTEWICKGKAGVKQ